MKILKGVKLFFNVILGSVSGLIQAFEFEDVTPEEAGFSSEKLSRFKNDSMRFMKMDVSQITRLDFTLAISVSIRRQEDGPI